jgi:O-antigen/teichoic acid export membrane protein
MVVVARILGKQGYGEFGIVRTTINLFATFGGMGLGLTANRYVAQFRENDKQQSGQIIGSSYVLAAAFGLIAALGLLSASRYLTLGVLHAPQLNTGLRIAAPLIFLGAINGAQVGILQGLEAYRRLAGGTLLQGIAALLCFSAGTSYSGLDGALVGYLTYACFGTLVFHVIIRKELARQQIRVEYRSLQKTLPIFRRFSIPVALMGLAVAPFKWLPESMLARKFGFQELGIFQASMTIATIFIAIISTLNAPLISAMASSRHAKSRARMQCLSMYVPWYIFLILAAPCVLFPELESVLFGQSFNTPHFRTVNLLLVLYCGLLVYYQGITRLMVQSGAMWLGFFTNVCEGLSLIVAFYFLSGYGAVGLGIAYVISYVVRSAITTPILIRQNIVSPRLIRDKWFGVSLFAFLSLVLFRIVRAP